jgi:hypothetical protein
MLKIMFTAWVLLFGFTAQVWACPEHDKHGEEQKK